MDNVFIMGKDLMANIIGSLKTLDVRGWDSMNTLVGCVVLLEQAMDAPPPEKKTETEELTNG